MKPKSKTDTAEPSDALTNLLNFCAANGTSIHPALHLKQVHGRGVGVYAKQNIKTGKMLMHIPTKLLYTAASIPEEFVSARARKNIRTHALLAAYLTFGPEDALEPLTPWTDTWPKVYEFLAGMPMFWPDECRRVQSLGAVEWGPEMQVSNPPFAILPPPSTGAWLIRSPETQVKSSSTCLAAQQVEKLKAHIQAIANLLPQYAAALSDKSNPIYWRFIHKWCCVNTRCFYYIFPGHKKPADANEAMALCPGMDMFNHTDGIGCLTKYDSTGYSVVANRNYDVDEELLLSYGAHGNDVLWAEYGFLLDKNRVDAIRIDRIILDDLNDRQKDMLAEYGYLGDFWLEESNVSWQVEVAAKLFVLSKGEWLKMVQEGVDPIEEEEEEEEEEEDTSPKDIMEVDEAEVTVPQGSMKLKVKRKIVEWILTAREETRASAQRLDLISTRDTVGLFADTISETMAQGASSEDVEGAYTRQAIRRGLLAHKRWCQIWEMCTETLRFFESTWEGSFVTGAPGRTKKDLDLTLENSYT